MKTRLSNFCVLPQSRKCIIIAKPNMHPLESPMGLNEERKKKRKTELAHKVSLILVFSVTIFYPNNILS